MGAEEQRYLGVCRGRGDNTICNSGVMVVTRVDLAAVTNVTRANLGYVIQNLQFILTIFGHF